MLEDSALQQAKRDLRAALLAQRQALSPARRQALDRQLCARVLGFFSERPGELISAFWPFRGEPDLRPALSALHGSGRCVYLPVLVDQGMGFRRWTPDGAMSPNRYGIPEPVDGETCEPLALDWVLTPLVGFSATGIRLGMGGGFYDRTFAERNRAQGDRLTPVLVGMGYGFQEVDSLPAQHWDVPLDAVITDRGIHRFHDIESEG